MSFVLLSIDLKQIVSQVMQGDLHKVLDLIPSLLIPSDKGQISHIKIEEVINNYLVKNSSKYVRCKNSERFFKNMYEHFELRSLLQVFCVGISSLQLFIQRNWMGIVDGTTKEMDNLKLNEEASKHLVLDGECFFPTVQSLPYLLVAKYILHDLKDSFTSFKVKFNLQWIIWNFV